ncbi:MAG: CpaF family protein, partial [Enterobacterales bacterium]|nr:CpaF family protein [Enterobacterales bacterium]
MDISVEIQEALRDGVLQNIDINTIEALVDDRIQLLAEMNRVLERVAEQQNIYLNSQNQNSFAEMMADE